MKYNAKEIFIFGILLLFLALLFALICRTIRKIDHKNQIQKMSKEEKRTLFDRLLKPFGYAYDEGQQIFITRIHAWQRQFGYEAAFDRAAVWGSMVFQCFPVYFDYMGKTWLMEIWKGQYGIACGCEIGLYHADRIVLPEDYPKTHFESVDDDELMNFMVILEGKGIPGFTSQMRHWWLGTFRVGAYCRPGRLNVLYQISFRDPCMMEAVLTGLWQSEYPKEQISVLRNTIAIRQHKENSLHRSIPGKLYARWVMWKNHQQVRLFRWYTRPFTDPRDRLLFLYFQIPFLFRRLMQHGMKGGKFGLGLSKKAE